MSNSLLNRRAGRPDDLSFVTYVTSIGYNYWDVRPTGDYATDCDRGRELAGELMTYIGQRPTHGNATLLSCIVGSMIDYAIKHGRVARGIEIGFFDVVGRHVMAAAILSAADPEIAKVIAA